MRSSIVCSTLGFLLAALLTSTNIAAADRPNVILIITDDQGYGDIGAHGNTMIRTPNLDQLHSQSIRFTDFHVDPTCSPTRAALMTGRYSTRGGVWHTVMGRSLLYHDEVTLPHVLSNAGYHTGMFGKWHLGDNYPMRPQDRGFDESVVHGGGGVGQTPDVWGNDYFDDTYWRNGEATPFEGYCTDVFFGEAIRFIEASRERPFFTYIATNVPHGPYRVPEKYAAPYVERGVPQPMANFYGMIENLDENVGKLLAKLEELGLAENTIVIFMTDNGTSAGVARNADSDQWSGFNAGMRGTKGSEYEGGHRVPFFVRWPAGKFGPARDIKALTAHIDVLPTIMELCGVGVPLANPLDGRSLAPLLLSNESEDWADRTMFVHSQRIEYPEKWRKSSVMEGSWRLVNGGELYDVSDDPGQREDLSRREPDRVQSMRGADQAWWGSLQSSFDKYAYIVIGHEAENPARLSAHDWHTDIREIPWDQGHVRRGLEGNGYWMIRVDRAGTYRFTLMQEPGRPIDGASARIQCATATAAATIPSGAGSVSMTLQLPPGPAPLQTWFLDRDGKALRGAYYLMVERLNERRAD